jgi:hypothetical protein
MQDIQTAISNLNDFVGEQVDINADFESRIAALEEPEPIDPEEP